MDEKIECAYGKIQNCFSISYDDLIQYFYQITRASNILNIARCIFVYDNMEMFRQFRNVYIKPVKFRDNMLFNQLTISLMAQGFRLKDIHRNKKIIKMVVLDLKNAGNRKCDFLELRQKYLCNVIKEKWCLLKAEKINVEYFNMYDQIEDVLWLEPIQESKNQKLKPGEWIE
jgi:hypothetical protein